MTNLLVLGGTTEGTRLGRALAEAGVNGTISMAGRVASPAAQALPLRVGGFGGAEGLARYIAENRITHVIDATHPFAARMSGNAVAACAQTGVPLIALTRAPWQAEEGDRWTHVPDIARAAIVCRYNLLPYIYTLHHGVSEHGSTMGSSLRG